MRTHILIVFVFCWTINLAHSFEWNKCKAFLNTPGRSIFGLGVLSASSQYSSSWGSCAAIGKTPEDKAQLFYAINSKNVIDDIVKGTGENYLALTRYWNCDDSFATKKLKLIRDNFSNLLRSDVERQYFYIKTKLDCVNGKDV